MPVINPKICRITISNYIFDPRLSNTSKLNFKNLGRAVARALSLFPIKIPTSSYRIAISHAATGRFKRKTKNSTTDEKKQSK